MPWFQSWPELEKKLQMKYIFGRQKKKDKCTPWFENNSKGGFLAPNFFFWKMLLLLKIKFLNPIPRRRNAFYLRTNMSCAKARVSNRVNPR